MRKINAVIFAIGLLSFLLPFIEVSCGENTLMVVTGKQLVTGFSVSISPEKLPPSARQNKTPVQRKFKGEKYARGILALVVVSLILGIILKYPLASYILVILSAVGGAGLLLLRSRIIQRATEKGVGFITVRFREGYWLLLGVFVLGFILNLFYKRKG